MAIIFGLTKFQQYLEHREFTIQCDNSALTHILNHPRQVGKTAHWISFINSFSFSIEHIPGTSNNFAYLLSRMLENTEPTDIQMTEANSYRATVPQGQARAKAKHPMASVLLNFPEVFKDSSQHQQEDPELCQIFRDHRKHQGFSLKDGVLLFQTLRQNTPIVGLPRKLFDLVFNYFHVTPLAAHLEIKRRLARISSHFWVKDLSIFIRDRVKSCT